MTQQDVRQYEEWLTSKLMAKGISEASASTIAGHVAYGRPTGSFARAVLENNLVAAFTRADPWNLNLLNQYVMVLLNDLPMGSWGSEEAVYTWQSSGGLQAYVD